MEHAFARTGWMIEANGLQQAFSFNRSLGFSPQHHELLSTRILRQVSMCIGKQYVMTA